MSARLGPAGVAIYGGLVQALLPGTDAMPAANAAKLTGMVDQALGWRPDLAADFLRGIRLVQGLPAEAAWGLLAADDPPANAALRQVILGCYLIQPEAMAALAYPGATSQPVPAGETPDYLAPGLLDPVKARGSIWRRD